MSRVLVMGGTRLVGKCLVEKLIENEEDVTIANRSGTMTYGIKVKKIIFDRNNRESIKDTLIDNYDIVYDMICYSPQNAKDIMDYIKTDKYIMISSCVVYDWGKSHKEKDVDVTGMSEFIGGGQNDIETLKEKFGFKQAYKLGKIGAEAIIKQHKEIASIRVRLPLVIGRNDHTQRMQTYIKAIRNNDNMYIDNFLSEVSFVEASNAADYLYQLKGKEYIGALNLADSGSIVIRDLIHMIEDIVGSKALYSAAGIKGGYNEFYSNTLCLEQMETLGICAQNSSSYLQNLVGMLALDCLKSNQTNLKD